MYELRDPIHKRITFNEFERSIIDHPFVQRLRFISQLGFTQAYVYPGAVHDRFSHALGAMHVAGRLFARIIASSSIVQERLSFDEIEQLRQRVRIAGLLHDLGHGPFSHASEVVFPRVDELPLDWSWWKTTSNLAKTSSDFRPDRQAVHEDYSVLLIQTLSEQGLFDRQFAQDICALIHREITFTNERFAFLHSILKAHISGEVDCDRMDYLLRDSYFCGVAYGQYDLDWLISSLSLAERDRELLLTISENGVRALEDMLLARYHMIDQVYFHKTKAGFTHYLEEAMRSKEITLHIPTDPYAYTKLRDGAVIEQLFAAAEHPASYWSHHLMHRIAAKRVLRLHDDKSEDVKTLQLLKSTCNNASIKWFTHSASNRLSLFSGQSSEQATTIYVAKKTLKSIAYIPIFEYSDLLKKYNEKLRFTDFFVHREDANRFQALL